MRHKARKGNSETKARNGSNKTKAENGGIEKQGNKGLANEPGYGSKGLVAKEPSMNVVRICP